MVIESLVDEVLGQRADLRATTIVLVGSRAHGSAHEPSDWDLVAFSGDERARETVALEGGEVEVLGPSACRARERSDLSIWEFELAHARLIHRRRPRAEGYIDSVAARFSAARPTLAIDAWARFWLARNQAYASLDRRDAATVALTAALAARTAARAFLLWSGCPYPADKWLLKITGERGGAALVAAATALVDQERDRAARSAALGSLTAELEARMEASGANWSELGDWWLRL